MGTSPDGKVWDGAVHAETITDSMEITSDVQRIIRHGAYVSGQLPLGSKGTHDESIEIDCPATDVCATDLGLFFSYHDGGVNLTPAHECAKQKCASQWNNAAQPIRDSTKIAAQ